MKLNNNTRVVQYIYHLPYDVHEQLCLILDENNKWEELDENNPTSCCDLPSSSENFEQHNLETSFNAGEHMGFSMQQIRSLRASRHSSPAERFLSICNQRNETVYDLFLNLCKMQMHQATLLLKPYIDSKYHALIKEGRFAPPAELDRRLPLTDVNFKTDGSRRLPINVNLLHNASSKHYDTNKLSNLHAKSPENNTSYPSDMFSKGAAARQAVHTSTIKPLNTYPHLPDQGRLDSGESSAETGDKNHIPYDELCIATNMWDRSNVIGRGGFGTVFRGHWKNTEVAIKRIEQRKNIDKGRHNQLDQLYKELKFLNSLRHNNILPLYGFSLDSEHPCLVCQLMPNGSLQDRIHRKNNTPPLTWHQRFNIALGTALGLQFLHTRYEKPLIHGDIKSANILLDSDLTPRIGDFGLALEGPISNYTHLTVTSIHGTRPYLPLDFLRSKQASTKVDTYSFGIVLFELVTGLWAYEKTRKPELLRELMRENGDLRQHMDRKAPFDPILGPRIFQGLVSIGQQCTANLAKERQDMTSVYRDLETLQNEMSPILGATATGNASQQPTIIKTPRNMDNVLNIPNIEFLVPQTQGTSVAGSVSPNFQFPASPEIQTMLTTIPTSNIMVHSPQPGMNPNLFLQSPQLYSNLHSPQPLMLNPNKNYAHPLNLNIQQSPNPQFHHLPSMFSPNVYNQSPQFIPSLIRAQNPNQNLIQQQNIYNPSMISPNPNTKNQTPQNFMYQLANISPHTYPNSSIPNPNFATPNQNSATPNQNSAIPNQNPATPNQNYAIPNPNSAIPNQNPATPNQNYAIPNPNIAILNPNTTISNSDIPNPNSSFLPLVLATTTEESTLNQHAAGEEINKEFRKLSVAMQKGNGMNEDSSSSSSSSCEESEFRPATLKSKEEHEKHETAVQEQNDDQQFMGSLNTGDLPNLSIFGV